MRFVTVIAIACVLGTAQPCVAQRVEEPGPTLARMLASVEAGVPATVTAFWDTIRARGTPLVDRDPENPARILAQFVWRSDSAQNVILENGVAGWDYVMEQLARVPGTDIWHITVRVPADVRIGYVFRENDSLIPWHRETDRAARWRGNRPDPFATVADSAQGPRSVLVGPQAAPDTWSVRRADVPAGRIEDLTLESAALDTTRGFSLYLPAGVNAEGLPLLVIFDGPIYRQVVRVPVILDNLVADGVIEPVAAVFVNSPDRNRDLPPNAAFATFIARELIPWLRSRYGVSADPARTILMGSSHGGLAAAWIAWSHPDAAGAVIAQSGSFWWSPPDDAEPEYVARRIASEPRRDVRFWLEVGAFEVDRTGNGGPGQVDVGRHLRDVLRAKGNAVEWSTFPGGHEYMSWRITTPAALRHFLAAER